MWQVEQPLGEVWVIACCLGYQPYRDEDGELYEVTALPCLVNPVRLVGERLWVGGTKNG
jgi:hypothetical protein